MEIFDRTNIDTTSQDEELDFLDLTPELAQKRRSQGRIILDRFLRNRTATAGAVFLIFMVLLCFLGPLVTGHNRPDDVNVAAPFSSPSLQFPFGSDDVGRDLLARALAGG